MMESFPNADDDYNIKYPTLLHNELYFAELVSKTHKRVLHGGINNGLNFIGNEYWLCKGSKRVRALLYKCVACKKSQNETLLGPEPSDHPTFCLTFDYAFSNTRVAFIGPLYIKNVSGKNNQMFKSYVYLLPCATARNVHFKLALKKSLRRVKRPISDQQETKSWRRRI